MAIYLDLGVRRSFFRTATVTRGVSVRAITTASVVTIPTVSTVKNVNIGLSFEF